MKSANAFRDQINTVSEWFQVWNECEQTVAIYSLLKKISPTQAKFLSHVLSSSFLEDVQNVHSLEQQANCPSSISNICTESIENAVHHLLAYLPLLRPGNSDAKAEYLRIVPKILQHSVEYNKHIEESRQLLSYCLIHPALSGEERAKLTLWMGHLDEQDKNQSNSIPATSNYMSGRMGALNTSLPQSNQFDFEARNGSDIINADILLNGSCIWQTAGSRDSGIGTDLPSGVTFTVGGTTVAGTTSGTPSSAGLIGSSRHAPLSSTLSAPPDLSKRPISRAVGANSNAFSATNGHSRLKRTVSVAPPSNLPSSTVSDWLSTHTESALYDSHLHLYGNEHTPLSPQSSCASSGSGSDSHHDDLPAVRNSFLEEKSGMKDVPMWLKSLRLHKYAYLFQQLAYDDMMVLNEEWLEKQNVTKGARHKIVISVQKLKERQDVLKQLEKEVLEGGNLKPVLAEMRNILNTPIKPYIPPEAGSTENEVQISQSLEDIPAGDVVGQYTRLMGKVCTQLLVCCRPDEEGVNQFIHLIDKSIHHEGFTEKQKKLLWSWKQQIQKMLTRMSRLCINDKQKKSWVNTFPVGQSPVGRPRLTRPPPVGRQQPPMWTFGNNRSLVGGVVTNGNTPVTRMNSYNTYLGPPVEAVKQQIHRTHSAPIRSNQVGFQLTHRPSSDLQHSATEPEINAGLESLCLSMTEAAIGGDGHGGVY